MGQILNNVVVKKVKYEDIESFMNHFDNEFEQYCEHKEEQMRHAMEIMNEQMDGLITEWRQQ